MADPLRSLRSADNLINKLGKESGSIRAFHGSPYDFDRFDGGRVGRGVGTQMAGHGLYFAESERLARRYRTPSGKMYQVEISQPQDSFIDFETPLSEQAAIAAAMDRAAAALPRRDARLFSKFLSQDPDGQNSYLLLDHMMGPEKAAQTMRGLGVPGTRFMDVTGEGTRNYVIFPGAEDSIRILRKYGLLAPVATGAAMEQE